LIQLTEKSIVPDGYKAYLWKFSVPVITPLFAVSADQFIWCNCYDVNILRLW